MSEFTIADVARIHGIKTIRKQGADIYAECPFCGDTRGKFSFLIQKGDKRNMYHCFRCGESGNALDLHEKLSGKFFTSPKEIAADIYECLSGGGFSDTIHEQFLNDMKEAPEEAPKATDEYCSVVYRALLNDLTLKEEHKKDLLRRGLSEEDIERYGFKSVPEKPWTVAKKLTNQGYKIYGVPGFYEGKYGPAMSSTKGYLCPAYDTEYDQLVGFQVRADNPRDGAKYVWFSSSGRKNGTGSGARATFLRGESSCKCMLIIEGVLKATIVYTLLKKQVTVIGIPGVNNLKCLDTFLSRYPDHVIFEAFDMDKLPTPENAEVFREAKEKAKGGAALEKILRDSKYADVRTTVRVSAAQKSLHEKLRSRGFMVHTLRWNDTREHLWKGQFKGLDDFLQDYGKPEQFIGYLAQKTAYYENLKKFVG